MFHQTLVHETPGVRVTYLPRAGVTRPTVVGGRVVLESDSPVVWLTFPGARHDIGRFHTRDGAFTGFYANMLTPVEIQRGPTDDWRTTDLFLDVFVAPGGAVHTLDRDELEAALRSGWIDATTAAEAEAEAARLVEAARSGAWPPASAQDWTLERARALAD